MIEREDINKVLMQLEAMKRQVSYNPVDTSTLERALFLLITILAERDAAFKAGEDAMRERAAHMIERAGKGTNIQFVTDVMGVAIRALANQPPAKGG